MFNIYEYNYVFGYVLFLSFFAILFVLFSKKISSLIDPLVMQLIWFSSILAFLVLYSIQEGLSLLLVLFIGSFIFFIFMVKKLYMPIKTRNYILNFDLFNKRKKILFFTYLLSVIILMYAQKNFFTFAFHHQIRYWFLYRFKSLHKGNQLSKLLDTGIIPIFYYFSFLFLFILRDRRIIILFFLLIYMFIRIFSGGRGALLDLLFSIGTFIYFYYPYFNKTFIKKINYFSAFFIPVSILLAIIVSKMFDAKHQSLKQGAIMIFNRIMASADGVYYYSKYNGLTHIKSGFMPYILSIFGIYLKHIFYFKNQDVGVQLLQLVYGRHINLGMGPNYIITLQIMVFGYYFTPFYIIFLAYFSSKLRNFIPNKNSIATQIIGFFLVSEAFVLPLDLELAIFRLVCFFIIFIFIFYPILKLRL